MFRTRVARTLFQTAGKSPRGLRWLASLSFVSNERMLAAIRSGPFRPIQKAPEVLGLSRLIGRLGARSLLEIGTASGGTSLLLSRALARPGVSVSVDLKRRYNLDGLVAAYPRGVVTHLLEGDSHNPSTADEVKRLGPAGGFDVVFIDGDHSYDGVRSDTLRFARLARPGGVVVFHDIQPLRSDDVSGLYVGGVPDWWQQLTDHSEDAESWTFVEDPEQSGFGIGVIKLPSAIHELEALVDAWARLPTRS